MFRSRSIRWSTIGKFRWALLSKYVSGADTLRLYSTHSLRCWRALIVPQLFQRWKGAPTVPANHVIIYKNPPHVDK